MEVSSTIGPQRNPTIRRRLTRALWIGVLLMSSLALVSFVRWRVELAEIRRIVAPHIDADADALEIAYQARDFMRAHVGYGRSPDYFLLPIFSFMRPTALQVLEEGGDCAYRSRAYIVILRLYGIEAHKRALYDRRGIPQHAVVEVEPGEGRPSYFVDLLFNVVHERADGSPLTLAELADEEALSASLARSAAAGNERVRNYPVALYGFDDVRTINWEKTAVTRVMYATLAAAFGEEAARAVPRPYLSEEPALMVITLAMGANGLMILLILIIRPRGAATVRRAAAGTVNSNDAVAGVAAPGVSSSAG